MADQQLPFSLEDPLFSKGSSMMVDELPLIGPQVTSDPSIGQSTNEGTIPTKRTDSQASFLRKAEFLVSENGSTEPIDSTPSNDSSSQIEDTPTTHWGILQSINPEYPTVYLSKTDGRGYLLGRHSECDVIFTHPQISNRHCLIFKENRVETQTGPVDCIFIEDLSTNGTYVNGKKIGRNQRRQIRQGDSIQLARYNSKLHEKFNDNFYIFKQVSPETNEPGLTISKKYLIGNTLGRGNFAEVKLATDRTTGKRYAVKIINKRRFLNKPKLSESLQREIAILMAIKHPSIISTHGVYDEQDFLYIVLELVDGGELFDLIVKKRRFTEPEARVIFYQLFQAIKYLHDRGITHRDMKPENILLDPRDPLRVKISDFGLAKIVGEESFIKTLCGTPNYVAPEVLQPPQHRQYSKKVDLWSLGVILYICLCGFPPSPLGPPNMQSQIKEGIYGFPSPYWDNISPEAISLIKQLLQVNPEKRLTVDEALEHPWMNMENQMQDDATTAPFFNTLKQEFTRVHTTLSPEKGAEEARSSSSTSSMAKREPASQEVDSPSKRPKTS
ncbi:Pkinase-domain-containing protein [Basidiobolus meristosporus CBS 931.73]|uniref:Pkinase-domain-containing protein n=1 Tax=Basidiobolus meristosporus CBS 931.73 TaxID=1314790 RepID=A0A1Y1XZE9_9FUNG|nr:Pkinase-domain-containing protein [Basidiobolus meristosporus CBS 931.73]|eukprot:ORX91130.1 Pkinase-domain-containing protein [Basidiobolus meristosporus CBS 931.73]